MTMSERKKIKKTSRFSSRVYIGTDMPLEDAIAQIKDYAKMLSAQYGSGTIYVAIPYYEAEGYLELALIRVDERAETDKEMARRIANSARVKARKEQERQKKEAEELATLERLAKKYNRA